MIEPQSAVDPTWLKEVAALPAKEQVEAVTAELMKRDPGFLTPLAAMKLASLSVLGTKVTDLSPLKDMTLTDLNFMDTKVSDLSPLKGMPQKILQVNDTKVTDL